MAKYSERKNGLQYPTMAPPTIVPRIKHTGITFIRVEFKTINPWELPNMVYLNTRSFVNALI